MRTFLLSISLLILTNSLFADPLVDILKKSDKHTFFNNSDFSAEYTIVKTEPGIGSTTRKALVFKRDAKGQYLVLLTEPVADRGKGYLMIADGLWLYDPHDRRFTFTSAEDAFQNTNMRNSDFAIPNLAGQYTPTSASAEKLGIFDTQKIELVAKTDAAPYPRRTVWISSDGALRLSKDYGLSGQLLRTVYFQYQKLQGQDVPYKIIFQDELKKKVVNGKEEKEATAVTITKPSFKPLDTALFTKEYLERISK